MKDLLENYIDLESDKQSKCIISDGMYEENLFCRSNAITYDDDPLLPILYRFLMLTRLQITRRVIHLLVFVSGSLVLIQTYQFLKIFDVQFWFKFASFYFATTYMVGSMSLAIVMYEIVMPRLKPIRKCVHADLIRLGPTFYKKIKYQAKMRTIIFVIHVILVAALVATNVILFSLDKTEFFLVSLFFKNHLPTVVSETFHWILCVLALITVFIMFLPAYYILYGMFYMEFQYAVLIDFTKHIHKILTISEDIDMSDNTYQERVKKNLIFIIKRHQEILIFSKEMADATSTINFIYFLNGILTLLYAIFAVYAPAYIWVQPLGGFATFFGIFFYACYHGQNYEDINMEFLANLENLEWYHWTRDNMRILMLMQLMAGSQVKLPLTTFISINYELFKQVMKLTYSVANILSSTKK